MSVELGDNRTGNVISLAQCTKLKVSSTAGSTTSARDTDISLLGQSNNVLTLNSRFPFYASVEVNDLPCVSTQFSPRFRNRVVATVKKILVQEFGRKRVRRIGYQYEIQHRNAELLIAALLRVQFYANQILLPEYNLLGERVELNGVSITWGVGRTLKQACSDRVRKRRARLPGAF